MSIQVRQRKKGRVFVVHYYDTDRKTHVNKTFDRRADAVAFESIVNLAKRRGELAQLDAGTETLQTFVDEWWSSYGDRFLAVNTQKAYRDLFKRFILPAMGSLPLRRITPSRVVALRDLVQDRSGDETARKTIALLQGVLERAVEWERIQINPTKAVKKPAQQRQSRPRVLSPGDIERLAENLVQQRPYGRSLVERARNNVSATRPKSDVSSSNLQHRVLIYLMGYAGLRPGEVLALEWGDIGRRTISVSKSVSFGSVGSTKTGSSRQVELLGPLREDLNRFRLASGSRTGRLVSRKDGGPWRDTDYRNWRKRVFQPAARGVQPGVEVNGRVAGVLRPYDLRHSFASLLFQEGRNPAYIAEQMGHSIQTLLSTYVHIIEELRDAPRQDAEALIRAARVDQHDGEQAIDA